jgi:hypothetical protein
LFEEPVEMRCVEKRRLELPGVGPATVGRANDDAAPSA